VVEVRRWKWISLGGKKREGLVEKEGKKRKKKLLNIILLGKILTSSEWFQKIL